MTKLRWSSLEILTLGGVLGLFFLEKETFLSLVGSEFLGLDLDFGLELSLELMLVFFSCGGVVFFAILLI